MWETIASKLQFSGWRLTVRTDTVRNPRGLEVTRDVVVHPGAVAIVARPTADEVILIRQYRHSTGEELIELPAGTKEDGEDPAVTAARELTEETGYTAARMNPVAEFYTAPGFTNELMHIFEATGLTPGAQNLEDDEFIDVLRVGRDDALRMVDDGRIRDAKTIAGLLMVFR
jgi:ADP-ribose pyrophosphatase